VTEHFGTFTEHLGASGHEGHSHFGTVTEHFGTSGHLGGRIFMEHFGTFTEHFGASGGHGDSGHGQHPGTRMITQVSFDSDEHDMIDGSFNPEYFLNYESKFWFRFDFSIYNCIDD